LCNIKNVGEEIKSGQSTEFEKNNLFRRLGGFADVLGEGKEKRNNAFLSKHIFCPRPCQPFNFQIKKKGEMGFERIVLSTVS
jgi:hypothetical protein